MELVARAAAIYVLLWLLVRATGKRELSALGPFDLLLIVVIGDVVQQAVTQEDMSFTGALIVLATMGTIVLAVSALSRRFGGVRRMIEGQPTVVVRDGQPLDDALEHERLPIEELKEAARTKGIDDLSKVRFAIVEPNGMSSFITLESESEQDDNSRPEATAPGR
jgi:uncharacterized membrane protein YcaP (DUF421 family)